MDDAEAQRLTEQITRKHVLPRLAAALRRMSTLALDWQETAEEFHTVYGVKASFWERHTLREGR
jgi:hypothetical protein